MKTKTSTAAKFTVAPNLNTINARFNTLSVVV
jgi:hypothetical protein